MAVVVQLLEADLLTGHISEKLVSMAAIMLSSFKYLRSDHFRKTS